MALILNIETATTVCSVCLARDGKVIFIKEHNDGYTHAENLTLFIQNVLQQSGLSFNDIDAVAVSMGPGSYTGLRIGVSVAKGLCYALDKPLIAVQTLQHLSLSVSFDKKHNADVKTLFCPMLDARRAEVYCAIYDIDNNEVSPVEAKIIDKDSFHDLLNHHKIYFFGNGAAKSKTLLSPGSNTCFIENIELSSQSMTPLSEKAFQQNQFADLVTFEPYYLKDFLIKKTKI